MWPKPLQLLHILCQSWNLYTKKKSFQLQKKYIVLPKKARKMYYWRNIWNIIINNNFLTWNLCVTQTYRIFVRAPLRPLTRLRKCGGWEIIIFKIFYESEVLPEQNRKLKTMVTFMETYKYWPKNELHSLSRFTHGHI